MAQPTPQLLGRPLFSHQFWGKGYILRDLQESSSLPRENSSELWKIIFKLGKTEKLEIFILKDKNPEKKWNSYKASI